MEKLITLDKADSKEARVASIRDTVAKEVADARERKDEQSAQSLHLAGELIVTVLQGHEAAYNAGISHKDFMERILPCALASSLNTTVRNVISDKRAIRQGLERVFGSAINYSMSNLTREESK